MELFTTCLSKNLPIYIALVLDPLAHFITCEIILRCTPLLFLLWCKGSSPGCSCPLVSGWLWWLLVGISRSSNYILYLHWWLNQELPCYGTCCDSTVTCCSATLNWMPWTFMIRCYLVNFLRERLFPKGLHWNVGLWMKLFIPALPRVVCHLWLV